MENNEKAERLLEAANAILGSAPDHRLNTVVLNKVLFYFDLASLRDKGEVFTGNAYIALQQGPVVAKYQHRLIKPLVSLGHAQQLEEWDGSKPIQLIRPVIYSYLDQSAMDLAARVTAYFAGQTSWQVSEYSHENPGWILAWDESRRVGRPRAIDMHIALQQIIEDDPWMDLPLMDDEEILAAADSEDGIDW